MSDSELSEASATPAPPDSALERSLRREVIRAIKAGEDPTLKTVRTAVEKELGLGEGWFKKSEQWGSKSKVIVHEQAETGAELSKSPLNTQKVQPSRKQAEASKSNSPLPIKRRADTVQASSKKKRKIEPDDSSDALSSPPSDFNSASEAETKPRKSAKNKSKPAPPKKAPEKKKAKSASIDEEDDDQDIKNGGDAADSDSEMSVLLDEEPQPKKKRKSKDLSTTQPKKDKSAKPKPTTDEDPDQAEIKRLQGWLVKCGVRKVWGKELKPYETSKAKIKHLKDMLAEVGMTGRFSVEKANQIKEARELAADIEAVQEGAERWGADNSDVSGDNGRPVRRLVRGAKNYDFLSSDGEETD